MLLAFKTFVNDLSWLWDKSRYSVVKLDAYKMMARLQC